MTHRRFRSLGGRKPGVVLLATLLAAAGVSKAAERPPPDTGAMNEVLPSKNEIPESYVSARSLLHFMRGSLSRDAGDDADALEQLKLAALYDALSPFPQFVVAQEHLRQKQFASAESAVRAALSLRPDHTPSLILLGRVLQSRGRPDDALNALNEATSRAPTSPEPYGELADFYLAQNELASAMEAAQKFEALTAVRDATVPRAIRLRAIETLSKVADALAVRGQSDKAEGLYRKASEEPLTRAIYLKQLARFFQSRGRLHDAAETYLQAFSASHGEAMFTFEAARLYAQVGERKSVIACAEALAVSAFAGDRFAREAGHVAVAIGDLLMRDDAAEEAAQVFFLAAKVVPEWSLPLFKRGEALERVGRLAEAASSFRKVSGPDELFASSQARAALCEHKNGSRAQGLMMLKGLSRAYPGNPDVSAAMASAMEQDGNVLGAVTQLETIPAERITPAVASMLARMAPQLGRTDKALAALETAVARHPDDKPLAFELVLALDSMGRHEQAITRARQLVSKPAPFSPAMNFLARALSVPGGSLDEAETFARQAVDVSPNNGSFAFTLGLIQSMRGRSEAVETLQRAADMLPSNAEAQIRWAEAEAKVCHRSEAIIGFTRALVAADASNDAVRLAAAKQGLAGLSSTCSP